MATFGVGPNPYASKELKWSGKGRVEDGVLVPEKREYFYLMGGDLDEFISNHYKRPFVLQQGEYPEEMLSQNSVVFATVPQEEYLDEDARVYLDNWLAWPIPEKDDWQGKMEFERKNYIPIEILLDDLYRKGKVPAGKYLIHVWW
jgi:hypothetical protein